MDYIHYGDDTFIPEKVKGKASEHMVHINKPPFGLWASPVDAEYGWKDWCQDEEFNLESFNEHFVFTLKDDAKILKINSFKDWNEVLLNTKSLTKSIMGSRTIQEKQKIWDYICKNYDGMLLILSNTTDLAYHMEFSAWDCDSIVIFNPDIVIIK